MSDHESFNPVEPDEHMKRGPLETLHQSQEVKKLRYWWAIVVPLLIVAVITGFVAFGIAANEVMRHMDFYGFEHEVVDHVQKNHRQFTASGKWCYAVLEKEDDYNFLHWFEDNKDDFPYTLNKHIPGLTTITDDMVMLFVGDSGWNQIGDYESIESQTRIKVLFGDGNRRIYRKKDLPYLKWKPEDSGVIPEADIQKPLMIMNVSLAVIMLGVIIACRKSLKTFWLFALLMGIISLLVGGILSSVAEGSYYRLTQTADPAISLFSAWMFPIGVCFVAIIGGIYKKYNGKVKMLGYSTVIGIITGIIASAITHGYLMIAYQEENIAFMICASLSFGSIAGFVLGWISSGVIKLQEIEQSISEPNEDLK